MPAGPISSEMLPDNVKYMCECAENTWSVVFATTTACPSQWVPMGLIVVTVCMHMQIIEALRRALDSGEQQVLCCEAQAFGNGKYVNNGSNAREWGDENRMGNWVSFLLQQPSFDHQNHFVVDP